MESMGTEAAQVVFLSMRNMDKLLEPSSEKQRDLGKKIVNSQVMHLSFGERSDLVRLQSPVRMMFKHQTVSDVNNPHVSSGIKALNHRTQGSVRSCSLTPATLGANAARSAASASWRTL